MAIVRCATHSPKGRTRDYVLSVKPVGYPDTAMVCGSKTCQAPGLVWLEADERAAYDRGERVFQSFTATMKMRVE
jgi:hypothetical protein